MLQYDLASAPLSEISTAILSRYIIERDEFGIGLIKTLVSVLLRVFSYLLVVINSFVYVL